MQLEELDREGEAFPRGTKTFLLPPQPGPEPCELLLPSIRFVLPAELELDPGGPRRLRVRADAHYVQQGERCILLPPECSMPRDRWVPGHARVSKQFDNTSQKCRHF